jgi:hypothetical protein
VLVYALFWPLVLLGLAAIGVLLLLNNLRELRGR